MSSKPPHSDHKKKSHTLKRHPKVHKNQKKLIQLAGVIFLISFIIGGVLFFLKKAQDVDHFRAYCSSIEKGELLDNIRNKSLDFGYLIELNPEPVGFADDPSFILRPSQDWLNQFGCWITVRNGRVLKVRRWDAW